MRILLLLTILFFLFSCGGGDGSNSQQNQSITNLSPSITTNSFIEHDENELEVINLQASDPESDQIIFKIIDGPDSSFFILNGNTLIFKEAPDYENPTDQNSDNTYEVKIEAYDGNSSTEKTINIRIENLQELIVLDVLRKSVNLYNPLKINLDEYVTLENGISIEISIDRGDAIYGDIEFFSDGNIEYIQDMDLEVRVPVLESINININTSDGRSFDTILEIDIPAKEHDLYEVNVCDVESENLRFTTQSSLYEFFQDNSSCNVIDGNLTIVEDFDKNIDKIREVDALINIREIRGDLIFYCSGESVFDCDDSLVNLEGFSNLNVISGELRYTLQDNFMIFPNLTSVRRLKVCIPKDNGNILQGFYSLKSITTDLTLSGCSNIAGTELSGIDAFHRLKSVGTFITSTSLYNISNFSPATFSNLESVGTYPIRVSNDMGSVFLGNSGSDGKGTFKVNFSNLSVYNSLELSEYAQIKNMAITTSNELKKLTIGCFNGIPGSGLYFIERVDYLEVCNNSDSDIILENLRQVNKLTINGSNIKAPNLTTVENLDLRGDFYSTNLEFVETLTLSHNNKISINFDTFLASNAYVDNIVMKNNGFVEEVISDFSLSRLTNSIVIQSNAVRNISGFSSFRNNGPSPNLRVVNNQSIADCTPFNSLYSLDYFPNAPDRYIYKISSLNTRMDDVNSGPFYSKYISFPYGDEYDYTNKILFSNNGCDVNKPKILSHSLKDDILTVNLDRTVQHIFSEPVLIVNISESNQLSGFPLTIDAPDKYVYNLTKSAEKVNKIEIEAIIENESPSQFSAFVESSDGTVKEMSYQRYEVRDQNGRIKPHFYKFLISFQVPFEEFGEVFPRNVIFKDIFSNRPTTIHDLQVTTWKRLSYGYDESTIFVNGVDISSLTLVTLFYSYPNFIDFLITDDDVFGRKNYWSFINFRS